MNTAPQAKDNLTPILIATSVILMVGFGIRASFGVFQVPIAEQFDWPRSDFSMAIAIQNLAWGIGQPLFGMFAEKYGDRKAIILGACIYAIGLVIAANAGTPFGQVMSSGVLVGLGVAGTGIWRGSGHCRSRGVAGKTVDGAGDCDGCRIVGPGRDSANHAVFRKQLWLGFHYADYGGRHSRDLGGVAVSQSAAPDRRHARCC